MYVTRTILRETRWRWGRGIARACRWRHDGAVIPGGKRGLSPVIVGWIAAALIAVVALSAPVPAHAAVGASSVTSIASGTDSHTYSFPSATYSNNTLYIAFTSTACASGVDCGVGVSVAPIVTSVTGAGLTFTEIGTAGGVTFNTVARRIQAWRALVTSGAGTGAVTVTMEGTTAVFSSSLGAAMIAFTGTKTSGTNGADAVVQWPTVSGGGTVTTLSVPMAAFADSNNRPVAFFSHRAQEATTPETGYTVLWDGNHSSVVMGHMAEWHDTAAETTPSASWATSSNAGGFALEIAAAAGGAPATLSSAASQSFTVGQASTTASTLTVTDASTPTITATNNLRIRIPAGLNMIWDTSVTTITPGGGAAGKVSATGVTYEDSNKTAVLDVTSNFAASDVLTIAGLKFTSFTATSSATSLQLVVAGSGGATAATDDKTITIGAAATLSSAANQSFTVGQASTTASVITVTEAATVTITATNNLRIRIPASFNMTWDTSVTSVTLGGTASGKVSATGVVYEGSNRTVVLDVTANFTAGQTLTITGLKFTSFTAVSAADNLELVTAGAGGATASEDDKTIAIAAAGVSSFLVEAAGGGSIGAQTSGTPFNIRITALDGNNNTVTSFTGTVSITSTGTLSAGGGTTAAFTAGVLASHSVTISNTGTFTITATKTAGTENGTSNAFTVNALQPAFVSGYTYRRIIDITDAQVSGGPHANFPMLFCVTLADLKTTANGGKVTDAQGDDIVFAASDGTTQLSHQVEKYDATTGELLAWVRVPSLASTTQLYIYYGNSAVTTFQGSVPGSVWNSNFKMVHHLSETSGAHQDSTSNNNDSTSISVATQGSTAGKINRADVFSAASSHQIQVASSTGFDIVSGSITVEAWVKTSSASYQFVVNRKTDAGSGWQLVIPAGAPEFWVYDDTPGTAGHKAQAVSSTAVNNNAFRYLVGRWTAGSKTAEIFVDGSPSASATASSFVGVTNTRPLVMGAEGDTTPGFFFDGTLDEVRFSNSARSNGWILTSYNNQNSCSGFYTVSAEQSSLVAPGHFNAYETSTVAGAITGPNYTKIAGVAVNLDMIALNPEKIAIATTFTGTVKVEVLDASNNSGALDANACRSSWTVIQTLSNPTFTDGRDAISFTVANAYPNVRLRISYPTSSPTLIGCTTDNFAVRPTAFTVTTSAATGGTAASQTGTSGTPAIKAGASFNLTAAATVAGYNGTPTIDNTKVVGTSTAGTIGGAFGAAVPGTGIADGNSFTYSEVGNFGLSAGGVRDTGFTSVDQAAGECVASSTSNTLSSGKYGCWVGSTATGATAFGRFIPDNFNVTYTTPPVFAPACGAFAYVGTKFTYPTAVMTVTARNSSNATTTNYSSVTASGAYMKLTAASLNQAPYNTQAGRYTRYDALGGGATPALDLSALPATTADPSVGSFTNGVGTLTFATGATGLGFVRSTTTPNAPFNADIALALNVIDADGVTFAGNPASFGAATAGNGIAFLSGNSMRFGRLVIRNANGTQLLPLPVRVEAQYWSGAPTSAFITNTLDNCTSIASADIAMGNYTDNLSACETAISGGGALGMGRKILLLAAPGSGNNGSVNLTVNLGAAASGNTCTTQGGAQGSATTANDPHLQGNWTGGAYDVNPTARATFGITRGAEEVIFVRENF